MRDKQLFNEKIFSNPVQKAGLKHEITVLATTDLEAMGWTCMTCGHANKPAIEWGDERAPPGSVKGVMQSYQCDECGGWLIGRKERKNVMESVEGRKEEREAKEAGHPRALPVPGKEKEGENWTNVLAGHEVLNP